MKVDVVELAKTSRDAVFQAVSRLRGEGWTRVDVVRVTDLGRLGLDDVDHAGYHRWLVNTEVDG